MKSLWKALRVWWYFRKLGKASKTIRRVDLLMADKPSRKRQQFWHDFIYHHDFRQFAAQKLNRELFG